MASKSVQDRKNILVLIIASSIILLLIAVVFLLQSLDVIEENPAGTLGNTGGNLNNGGLFVEDGNTVYFANPVDNNYIYSMNPDGSDIKLVIKESAKYLNSAGKYLYYYQFNTNTDVAFGFVANVQGIYQLKKGTNENAKCLERTVSGILMLIDNALYYQHYDNQLGVTLYKQTLDGKIKGMVCEEIINPCCVINGNIYYPDQNNYFYLNQFDTTLDKSNLYMKERMYNPVFQDGYIYYIGVGNGYDLRRYNLSSKNIDILTEDRVDCFNILGNTIFYQKNSTEEPALIRMSADGNNKEIIAHGNYTNINMTSTYTYYSSFGNEVDIYRVPTLSGSAERFNL